VTLDALREECICCCAQGLDGRPITISDSGDTIDLRGWARRLGGPSIVEENVITFRRHRPSTSC